MPSLSQDFHFGILDARNYTPNPLRSYTFFIFFILAALTVHKGAGSAPSGHRKTGTALV